MMESFGCKCILANHKMSEYYGCIQVAVAIFTSIGSRIPKNLFPGNRSFTVIEFEQYKLDELKARHCLFMFFVVVVFLI